MSLDGGGPDLILGAWADLAAQGARAVRLAVFVEEQGVPVALEWDADDAHALHVLIVDGPRGPVATARLLPARDGVARIGRMAVLVTARGRGLGRRMLRALVEAARSRGDREVSLSAQCHALGFYAAEGFVAEGLAYEEAGLMHRGMRLRL
ncbi:GNAT family N-acetyltransferase [Piscinibacter sp. Jin2]|uniref:GNAT family N-acetyltransferase n=1 Tax=Aquariibacter lacus TaxID=2801332 RepID=A0A9X1BQX5_9BURK|nr:GNAT family N-acetyltransferase [Piscinibacter lacus]MBL0719344.1 GNAT family N-acetyltransferase [Piscinibacter lacus]